MGYLSEIPIGGGPCTLVLIEGFGRLPILAGKVSGPEVIHEPVMYTWDIRVVEMMIIAFAGLIRMIEIYNAIIVDRVIVVLLRAPATLRESSSDRVAGGGTPCAEAVGWNCSFCSPAELPCSERQGPVVSRRAWW